MEHLHEPPEDLLLLPLSSNYKGPAVRRGLYSVAKICSPLDNNVRNYLRGRKEATRIKGSTKLSTVIGEYTVTTIVHSDCRHCFELANAAIAESLLVGNPFISKEQWGLNSEAISELRHGATVVKTLLHRNYLEASEKVKEEVLRGIQYCV